MKNLHDLTHRGYHDVVAQFGEAILVCRDGRYYLYGGSRLDCVEAIEWVSIFMHEAVFRITDHIENGVVYSATLQGHLESALKTTFSALVKSGSSSAPQLHQDLPEEGITVTAWNNRLADLHAVRLVSRIRKGKVWEYKPIVERIMYGRRISYRKEGAF